MDSSLPAEDFMLKQFKENVSGAFERIYRYHVADLLEFASQRLSSLEEARDLVQDVFADIYERKEALEIKCSLRAYLFTALKYKIIDHIRKNAHRKFYIEFLHSLTEEQDDSFFDNFVFNDLHQLADKEIQRLPARMREAFLLSRQKNLTIAEIARSMNVSEQTVKNQISTAITKLRPVVDKLIILLFIFSFLYSF